MSIWRCLLCLSFIWHTSALLHLDTPHLFSLTRQCLWFLYWVYQWKTSLLLTLVFFLYTYEFGYVKGLKVYLINIFEHQNYLRFFPSLSFLHCKFNFFSNKTCRYIKNNLFKYNYNKDYCINSTFKSIGLIQLW